MPGLLFLFVFRSSAFLNPDINFHSIDRKNKVLEKTGRAKCPACFILHHSKSGDEWGQYRLFRFEHHFTAHSVTKICVRDFGEHTFESHKHSLRPEASLSHLVSLN
jgi:hypothetical protein